MNITDAIKKYCKTLKPGIIPIDEYGYWNINVQFTNSERREDETQFDIKPHRFDCGIGKCDDLVELWRDFCKENGYRQNSVIGICFANM